MGDACCIPTERRTATSWLPQNVETSLVSPDTIAAGQLRAGGRPEVALLRLDAMNIHRHSNFIDGVANPLLPAAMPLLSGVSVQGLITMDLDGDDFPDAVAVDTTGQFHLL